MPHPTPDQLNAALVATNPLPVGGGDFGATINAHGSYSPLSFVLRLSPQVHRTLATLPRAAIVKSGDVGLEGAQAFSTYLHETIHWWQHVGSTYGLMSSLSFPSQAHANFSQIKRLISEGMLRKSIRDLSTELKGPSNFETLRGLSNMIVNNHFDLGAFRSFSYNVANARAVASNPMFQNLGHQIELTYAHNLAAMSGVVDPEFKLLPDPRTWDKPFDKLRDEKVEGYYYGSRVGLWPLGAREIMEGQACFSQIQFLHFASGGKFEWKEFRALGILHGVYEEAFKIFLERTKIEWPDSVNHPAVALFLLICDMAINPSSGFPFDPWPHYQNFIDDTLPGSRFVGLSTMVRLKYPEALTAIKEYSRLEYEVVSERLSEIMLDESPLRSAARCEGWARGPMSALMDEYRTYNYGPMNFVVRVLLSHFLGFMQDKLKSPEVFCWPGAWMAGDRVSERIAELFERHGALFVDKEDDDGVFPRLRDNYDPQAVQNMFDTFYASTVVYDMTDQLIRKSGPFDYSFRWLKPSATKDELKQFADRHFNIVYDIWPDDIPWM